MHGFDEFLGNLYHLNAEEEPENEDYPKNVEFRQRFGPRGVLKATADGKIEAACPPNHTRGGRPGFTTTRAFTSAAPTGGSIRS